MKTKIINILQHIRDSIRLLPVVLHAVFLFFAFGIYAASLSSTPEVGAPMTNIEIYSGVIGFFLSLIIYLLLVVMFGGIVGIAKETFALMEEFAQKHNFNINPESKASIMTVKPRKFERKPGILFFSSTEAHLNNEITGEIDGREVKAYHYTFWNSGAQRLGNTELTIFEIDLESTVPHIFLSNVNNAGEAITDNFHHLKESLKVSFPEESIFKNFDVYVQPGFGQDAMQIIDSDFTETLEEEYIEYSIELVDHYLFIYFHGTAHIDEMEEMYLFISKLDRFLKKVTSYKMPKYTEKPETNLVKVRQL